MANNFTHFMVRSSVLKDLATIRAALPSGNGEVYSNALLIEMAVGSWAEQLDPSDPAQRADIVDTTLTKILALKEATRTRKVEAARRRFHPVPSVAATRISHLGVGVAVQKTPPGIKSKIPVRVR